MLRKSLILSSLLQISFAAQSSFAVPDPKPFLLPEFLSVPFSGTDMPPELTQQVKDGKVDLRKLAITLVERKRQFQDRWKNEDNEGEIPCKTFPESCDDLEIVSFFPEQYIDSLIERGQLNMHQTGESRGLTQRELRAKAENSMIGIRMEPEINQDPKSILQYLRPKYGLVNFSKPCGIKVNPNRLLIYGQVIIVYANSVKMRTTYTYGDSLSSYCHYIAGDTKFFVDPKSMLEFAPPEHRESRDVRYVETQTWGPIDLSDIQEFRIPAERKDLLEKLKRAGKPIYSYSRENIESCDYHMDESEIGIGRGELLFSADGQAAAKTDEAKSKN